MVLLIIGILVLALSLALLDATKGLSGLGVIVAVATIAFSLLSIPPATPSLPENTIHENTTVISSLNNPGLPSNNTTEPYVVNGNGVYTFCRQAVDTYGNYYWEVDSITTSSTTIVKVITQDDCENPRMVKYSAKSPRTWYAVFTYDIQYYEFHVPTGSYISND